MPKVEKSHKSGNGWNYRFYCPGCKCSHFFKVGDGGWSFNGDENKPTVNPSLLVTGGESDTHCHSFIRDGKIQFLGDSKHELAGQTVDLPEA
jgi:hypothetical protein